MRDSKRDRDVYHSLMDSVGEGEGGMIWENGTETCLILYVSISRCSVNNFFIQSEVSQKEKHQYSILTHLYGI